MTTPKTQESHHGVLMNLSGVGVLIIGKAGIGKSNLALELLHHGHQLIADDSVDFTLDNNDVIGHCPDMSEGLLHSREIGLISVEEAFDATAWQKSIKLSFVIALDQQHPMHNTIVKDAEYYQVCGQRFPKLRLNPQSTASLLHRITTWLSIKMSTDKAEHILSRRQQQQMMIQ